MDGSGALRSRLTQHAVRGPEKAPRVLQELAVGGMVCRCHADDPFCQLRLMLFEIFHEFELRLRRSDEQNLVRIRDRLSDA